VFRNSAFGINSMLYLVDMAIDSKDMQLAAFYLNQLKKRHLNKEYQARWLEAKTRLELGVGKQDKALETYGKLMATNEPVPAFTRLRMALLMQQRGELPKARAQLLDLWSDKDDYPTAMQAEILFWLGEGEQAMRNTDAALDYYLKLAWKYPQENIWALTAMYRASMIYEQRGKFETAKKFLKTVIKRADTKEQREAAKARLSTIESKSGGGKSKNSSDDQGIQYPF
jgi:TolA-binding protein